MRSPIHRSWLYLVLAIGLVAVSVGAWALWKANQAVEDATGQVARESTIRFTSSWLDGPAGREFELFGTSPGLSDVTGYLGRIYLCGASGLYEYDTEGALLRTFRVGRDLPAASLRAMVTTPGSENGKPALMITTGGEGLLAFDGERFRQIRPEDAPGRMLTAALALTSGRTLIGTEKMGVLVYDGSSLTSFQPGLAGSHITALAGEESDLWVGTLDQGTFHWRAGQLERFGETSGLPDNRVTSITIAADMTYVSTPMGVGEFKAGRFTRVLAPGYFAQSALRRGEALLLGFLDEGTVEIPLGPQPGRTVRPSGQSFPGEIVRLLELEGRVYILAEDGLYAEASHGGGWRRVLYTQPGLLTDRNVSALAADSRGSLWIGYFDRGLDIVDLAGEHATHIEDEHVFCVNRIAHDRESQTTAVATANGLVLYGSGRQPQVLGRKSGLIADHVTDVLLEAGRMIVATPAGLTFVDASGARSLYAFHGLINNHVYTLATAHGQLLAGTLGGLSILDGGAIRTSFTTANSGLSHNWITSIVPVGDEWFVGTYGAGLLRLDAAGIWHAFPDATGSFEINPNAMLVTSRHVYAGTLGRGLYVYDREASRWTPIRSGLPSHNVTAIASHGGSIYVGTDNGIARMPDQDVRLP